MFKFQGPPKKVTYSLRPPLSNVVDSRKNQNAEPNTAHGVVPDTGNGPNLARKGIARPRHLVAHSLDDDEMENWKIKAHHGGAGPAE